MSNNEGDVSKNVTVKKSRFFQLCHGYFNSLKTSNSIGFISLELNFGDQARGGTRYIPGWGGAARRRIP